ncbi:transcription factor bHLH162 [Andrographis paniculata]|uniref:transcription factor bHLH162 n=1 Tax=Andrographis paniculata TaxID=175694 RepID=UPI0021E6F51F|nr:transcription factor bHLH162 [Andrographis paniculata]
MESERSPNSVTKADRKTVEKNRRNHMKSLCSSLSSLIVPPNPPTSSSREGCGVSSIQDQVESATHYIRRLEEKVEMLRNKKTDLQKSTAVVSGAGNNNKLIIPAAIDVDVSVDADFVIKVALMTDLNSHHSVFMEALRILSQEAAAQILTASYSVTPHLVFHTIYANIEDGSGEDSQESLAARISERLRSFVHGNNIIN